LQRIDEDRHDSHVIVGTRPVNKFQMAFVKTAHGRHEADALARTTRRHQDLPQFLDGADNLHARSSSRPN
jgi:hypothetical protein